MKNNNVSQAKSNEKDNNISNNAIDQNEGDEEYEDDFENDVYLIELHKRLTSMKKERKKAQQDEVLLQNRLNLLKGEEEKTWKKIDTARKKNEDKLNVLQRQEEQLKMKQEVKLIFNNILV